MTLPFENSTVCECEEILNHAKPLYQIYLVFNNSLFLRCFAFLTGRWMPTLFQSMGLLTEAQIVGSTKRALFMAWFSNLPSTLDQARTEQGLSVILRNSRACLKERKLHFCSETTVDLSSLQVVSRNTFTLSLEPLSVSPIMFSEDTK
jgi:hypothetical protein